MDHAERSRFREVYDATFPAVYVYFVRRLGDRATAEDLTQETFAAVAREMQRGDVDRVTTAWVIGVARHKLADHWRRRERDARRARRMAATQRPEPEWDPSSPDGRILTALATLPGPQRAAVVLHYLDDVPVEDVARMLHKSVAATESLLARGRRGLRAAYGEELVDA